MMNCAGYRYVKLNSNLLEDWHKKYIVWGKNVPLRNKGYTTKICSSYLVILSLHTHENQISSNTTQAAFKVRSRTNSLSFIKDSIDVVYCLLKLTTLKLKQQIHILDQSWGFITCFSNCKLNQTLYFTLLSHRLWSLLKKGSRGHIQGLWFWFQSNLFVCLVVFFFNHTQVVVIMIITSSWHSSVDPNIKLVFELQSKCDCNSTKSSNKCSSLLNLKYCFKVQDYHRILLTGFYNCSLCPVPEYIHTHPTEGHWKGVGHLQAWLRSWTRVYHETTPDQLVIRMRLESATSRFGVWCPNHSNMLAS